MKPNQRISSQKFFAEVYDLSFQGLGVISDPNGRVSFVSGVWPGDQGWFELKSEEKRFSHSRLLELTVFSIDRRHPPCTYHGHTPSHCGGCSWMMIKESSQLKWKQRLLTTQLKRQGLWKEGTVKEIRPSPKGFAYRNRAVFKTDGQRMGFQAAQSHALIDIVSCPVLNPAMAGRLSLLRRKYLDPSAPPCSKDGKTTPGDLRRIAIDDSLSLRDLSETSWHDQKMTSFRQANEEQNQFMKLWLARKIKELSIEGEILELFCGNGNFTEVIRSCSSQKIRAVEGDSHSLKVLQSKGFWDVEALRVDLFKVKAIQQIPDRRAYQLLVLDPPRSGFKALAEWLLAMPNLKNLIYISCDIATFARDCRKLPQLGWEVSEIQTLDQFPQTPHIETLSLWQRQN